jgi:hypothetical protein
MEEREGVLGILLLLKLDKGICVYKGTCPPTILSSFLFSSCNILYSYPILLLLSSSLVPSIPPPLSSPAKPPILVQPSQACPAKFLPLPYCEFPGLRFCSLPTITQNTWSRYSLRKSGDSMVSQQISFRIRIPDSHLCNGNNS